jgi:Zn-dependent peptidase ImmA (M78 family)
MPYYRADHLSRFSFPIPYYDPTELDRFGEQQHAEMQHRRRGAVRPLLETDDLCVGFEQNENVAILDNDFIFTGEEVDVLGKTIFRPGKKSVVRIARKLSNEEKLRRRFRLTLAHEFTHADKHTPLWQRQFEHRRLTAEHAEVELCRRAEVEAAGSELCDPLEWQAWYGAGALLIPRIYLEELVNSEFGRCNPLFIVEGSSAAHRLVTTVANEFDVSREAARIRLLKTRFMRHRQTSKSAIWGWTHVSELIGDLRF